MSAHAGFSICERPIPIQPLINCGVSYRAVSAVVTNCFPQNQYKRKFWLNYSDLPLDPGLAYKQKSIARGCPLCGLGKVISIHNKFPLQEDYSKIILQIISFSSCCVEDWGIRWKGSCLNLGLPKVYSIQLPPTIHTSYITSFNHEFHKVQDMLIFNLQLNPADLPENLNVDNGSLRVAPSPTDCCLLVKKFICSDTLSQRPLLVLTAARATRVGMVPETKYLGKHW